MNKSIFGAVGFVLGAAVGSLVTWKLIEQKYMDMADEEIKSVKEMYARKSAEPNVVEFTKPVTLIAEYKVDKFDEEKLANLIGGYQTDGDKPDYTAYSQAKQAESTAKPAAPEVEKMVPYIIDPTEYGEFSEYEQRELTYYKDGIICENDTDMIDPDDIFGDLDVGDHFGEYENDRVFVRDDKRQVDYEILRDERTFMEVI